MMHQDWLTLINRGYGHDPCAPFFFAKLCDDDTFHVVYKVLNLMHHVFSCQLIFQRHY